MLSRRRVTLICATVLSQVLLTGCSNPFENADPEFTVKNETAYPVLFLGMGLEQAALIDPNPLWRVEDHLGRLLEVVEVRRVELEGWRRGDDVIFLLYPVRDDSGEAALRGSVRVTYSELRRSDFSVVLRTQ